MAILLIHGGAGTIVPSNRPNYEAGLRLALEVGYAALTTGRADGSGAGVVQRAVAGADNAAVAGVLAAVAAMEGYTEAFNSGRGGALTREGTVELDACLMVAPKGQAAHAGAVAGVTNTAHPIVLADRVRRETPHVLLVGAGADALTEEPEPNESLITAKSRASYERWRAGHLDELEQPILHGRGKEPTGSNTVGAVAIDDDGNLAAATSTGGRTGQWPGRVGDAPLPGLGTFATADMAISCTGVGEAFMEAATAAYLAARVASGEAPEAAVRSALADVSRQGGNGGLISVLADGRVAFGFNSPQMAYGHASPKGTVSEVATSQFVRVLDLR